MIVVDASALTAFILREEGWEELAEYMVYTVSVDHVVKEVVNAIWKAAYLRRLINDKEAHKAYILLKTMIGKNILLEPELKYIDSAFEISMTLGIPIYDALYLALASTKKLPLLTLDTRQRNIATRLGITTKP
ncbi:MAG: type II toxin-antitoxin system VapC family toxin [Thermoproteales archaeon]|nr:type II toxin-antitoxin system VapC family toxin [Thermoproteales archaeon]